MSLFSSLKRALLGSPKPIAAPTPATARPKTAASRVPQVAKPLTVPATTDQLSVTLPRNASKIEPGMACDVLHASNTQLKGLPEEIEVRIRLNLSGSSQLESLPSNLRTGSLVLHRCTALKGLPHGLEMTFLTLAYSTALESLPDDLKLRGGGLNLQGCENLKALPDGLGEVASLNLSGCKGITALPRGLKVTSWMNISGTGITEIPDDYQNVGLRSDKGAPLTVEEALA